MIRDHLSSTRRNDDGFTLLELIVAFGIFTLLMIVSSVFFIGGIRTIRQTTDDNRVQGQEQNAAEWMSRMIRFIDNPSEALSPVAAVTFAGTFSGAPMITFTTRAAGGKVDRVPYRVTITRDATGIVASVWTPDMSTGSPVYTAAVNGRCRTIPIDTTCTNRLLVPASATNTPVLGLRYWATVNGVTTELIPPVGGTLTAAQLATVRAIEFTITGSAATQAVAQRVTLANAISS